METKIIFLFSFTICYEITSVFFSKKVSTNKSKCAGKKCLCLRQCPVCCYGLINVKSDGYYSFRCYMAAFIFSIAKPWVIDRAAKCLYSNLISQYLIIVAHPFQLKCFKTREPLLTFSFICSCSQQIFMGAS